MFKSKRRLIIVPQSEHLRLVGILSMLWGNTDFDLPPIELESMIAGMSLHDRGYGLLDNFPIGATGEEEWNGIARRSFSMFNSDIVADTIVKYHIRRLAAYSDSTERKAMAAEFSAAIDQQLSENNLSKELFGRIDHITNLTDSISFDFCFDVPNSGSVSIFPHNKQDAEVTVQYHVEDGVIDVMPWPFSVEKYKGYILAYRLDGYPENPDLLILPYQLVKK